MPVLVQYGPPGLLEVSVLDGSVLAEDGLEDHTRKVVVPLAGEVNPIEGEVLVAVLRISLGAAGGAVLSEELLGGREQVDVLELLVLGHLGGHLGDLLEPFVLLLAVGQVG